MSCRLLRFRVGNGDFSERWKYELQGCGGDHDYAKSDGNMNYEILLGFKGFRV